VLGAAEPVAATDADLAVEAQAAVASGLSAKDAAAQVAARLGVSRRRAYDAVVASRANRG
jgi:16S rRNA (cytidine1402-2'-O)-methyltransferase